jgi:ParB-like chromosome segregation protein Spo0J
MQSILIPIKEVKLNPNNPRILKGDKFTKLKHSITSAPWMLEARPIVIDEDNIVLGGNMRYQALKELGYKEIHCVRLINLTAEQKQEFVIKDNVSFGEWDWELLANDWDSDKLEEWGLELPIADELPNLDEEGSYEDAKCLKITFNSLEDAQAAAAQVEKLIEAYEGASYSFVK